MNKIIFFGYSEGTGITYHLTLMCLELAKLNIALLVVHDGQEQNPGLLDRLNQAGIQQLNLATHSLTEHIDLHTHDYHECIFHCQGFRQVDRAIKFKHQLNSKIVLTLNAYRNGSWYSSLFSIFVQLKYSHKVDHWIFLSEFSFIDFTKMYNRIPHYSILPLGVEYLTEAVYTTPILELHDILNKNTIPFNHKPTYILYIAQFYENKQHDLLIDIFEELVKKFPDLRLLLLGVGPTMATIESKCQFLELRDQVHFLGRVNRFDVSRYIKLAHLSITLSKNETFSHAIVEPLALGVPVFCTKVGIAADAVHHLENGFILPNTHVKSVANTITAYLSGSIILKGSLSDKFKWPNIAKRHQNLYRYLSTTQDA